MLKLMRDNLKNLKWVLWAVVFVFVFVLFEVGGQKEEMIGLAARVGDVTISESDFLRELRTNEQRYREMFGEQWDSFRDQMDLPAMTLQGLIDRELLLMEARRMGLRVSDKDLLQEIFSIPAFQREDGTFVGEEIYTRILRANQLTPQEFETGVRREILLQRLQQAMEAGIVIPESEVEREFRRRYETASFEVAFLGIEHALDQAVASEDDARSFYQAHTERFTNPEQRQLRFLVVDSSRLRRELTVPDEQIAEYYNANQEEFVAGEQVRARHILIRSLLADDERSWQDAESKAREVFAEATAPGADFPALARRHSQDPGSRDGGGDLGWFERGRMVPEFENAVFALEPGQVSEPVRSQFGYHVIRLEDRRPGATQPLDEVRDTIRFRLVQGMEEAEGTRRAQALRERIATAKPSSDEEWRELAEGDDAVSSNVTPFFSAGDVIPGLGQDPTLVAEAQREREGFIGGPHRTSRGWVVYKVVRVRKAGTAPFEDVREEAMEGARRRKAVEILAGRVQETLAAEDWRAEAEALGAMVQEVEDHRRGTSIPGVGMSLAVETAIFGTEEGGVTPVVPVGERGVAAARVTARTPFDPEAFAFEKESIRQSLGQEEMGRLMTSILTEAKRRNPPVINPDVVERFRPQQG